MPYADQPKLEAAAGGAERFLALTDWDGDGVIDASVVADAQVSADGWIDGFIPEQYSPPVANPSEALKELAAAEAIYRIRTKRDMAGPAEIEQRKERERYLEMIRSGRVRPDALTAIKSAPVRSGIVQMDGDGAHGGLSRRNTKGWW